MRPGEIDFSSRAKHYFDISNGEVLAGANQLNEHVASGANPDQVKFLGSLLRNTEDDLPYNLYAKVDYDDWTPEKFQAYGKWVKFLVDEPDSSFHRKLSTEVFDNARRLGLGAGSGKIRSEYGGLTAFYVDIGASNVLAKGNFDDWDIDEFIAHIQKVGGERKPTMKQINALSKESARNPSAKVMAERYREIGGFHKLLELAGYNSIILWERDDYIDWGVRFMHANAGLLPRKEMMEHLSRTELGPSPNTVRLKFSGLRAFQSEVEQQYVDQKHDKVAAQTSTFADIKTRLARKTLPVELFEDPISLDDCPETTIKLYSKYIVLEEVLSSASVERKVKICRQTKTTGEFIGAIRKYSPIDHAEIEYAATVNGVFDTIWPLGGHIEDLKLDDEFYVVQAASRHQAAARQRAVRQKRRRVKAR